MPKKPTSDRLAEAQKAAGARLAEWGVANPQKMARYRESWRQGTKAANERKATEAEERRLVWLARAKAACDGMRFGDAIVYRGRVNMCLGPMVIDTERHGRLPVTAFRFWCVNCGAPQTWTVKGAPENLVVDYPKRRTLRTPARCSDCAARVKSAGFNALLKDQPFGYSERALANMSAADREFVCRAVAEQEDIG